MHKLLLIPSFYSSRHTHHKKIQRKPSTQDSNLHLPPPTQTTPCITKPTTSYPLPSPKEQNKPLPNIQKLPSIIQKQKRTQNPKFQKSSKNVKNLRFFGTKLLRTLWKTCKVPQKFLFFPRHATESLCEVSEDCGWFG